MKGLFGLGIIGSGVILVFVLYIFGGAVYDITTTSARCALYFNPEMNTFNYTCNSLIYTLGNTVLFPDTNVKDGTNEILAIRALSDKFNNQDVLNQLNQTGILTQHDVDNIMIKQTGDETESRFKIIRGLVGLFVILMLLIYVFIKATPSSLVFIDSRIQSIVMAFVVVSLIMVMVDSSPDTGVLSIEGLNMPFKGVRTLLSHPEVMYDIVDQTSLLPGTMTTDEILVTEGEVT